MKVKCQYISTNINICIINNTFETYERLFAFFSFFAQWFFSMSDKSIGWYLFNTHRYFSQKAKFATQVEIVSFEFRWQNLCLLKFLHFRYLFGSLFFHFRFFQHSGKTVSKFCVFLYFDMTSYSPSVFVIAEKIFCSLLKSQQ